MCANKQPKRRERVRRTGGGLRRAAPRSKPGRAASTDKKWPWRSTCGAASCGRARPVKRCSSQVGGAYGLRAAFGVWRATRVPVSPSNAPPPDDDARALNWVNLQSTGQPKKKQIHPSWVPLNASLVAIQLQTGPPGLSSAASRAPGCAARRAHGGSGGSTAAAEHETVTHTPPQLRRRAAQKAKACPPSPPRPTFYMNQYQ